VYQIVNEEWRSIVNIREASIEIGVSQCRRGVGREWYVVRYVIFVMSMRGMLNAGNN
jgi:hypothetical protein